MHRLKCRRKKQQGESSHINQTTNTNPNTNNTTTNKNNKNNSTTTKTTTTRTKTTTKTRTRATTQAAPTNEEKQGDNKTVDAFVKTNTLNKLEKSYVPLVKNHKLRTLHNRERLPHESVNHLKTHALNAKKPSR